MSTSGLRFLRPCLCKDVAASTRTAYVRLFHASQKVMKDAENVEGSEFPADLAVPFQVQERVKELKRSGLLEWPRIEMDARSVTTRKFSEEFGYLAAGEKESTGYRTLQGRVSSVRAVSKGLVFIDIIQDQFLIQVYFNYANVAFNNTAGAPVLAKQKFWEFLNVIKRGDIISCRGIPLSNKAGQLCLAAQELCTMVSPSLETLPTIIKDREMRVRKRHVDFLTSLTSSNTIRARSHIIQHIRSFLLADNFMEVQTPILADKAGGAVAKPFTTHATEFASRQLALRIAPELWLKRLIIGGMDRVFEIGPAFRNEGLDATHNPEFTTCEFYKSFAELEELIQMTEELFSGLAKMMDELRTSRFTTLVSFDQEAFAGPFKRIAFIPGVEEGLGEKLPDLRSENAEQDLIALFEKHDIPLPASPTLPRLLDKLAALYIEPQCITPTFITHHPACMAPLSKSFICETTGQEVSARAELFVGEKEIANMYEEENSPLEQRRKFVEQGKWRDGENEADVDESYLEALTWGMPPTGGWGLGIDRLVMLLTGAKRIGDVQAFGSLRNVVGLGTQGTEMKGKKSLEKD